jgi:hypothetical protein
MATKSQMSIMQATLQEEIAIAVAGLVLGV